MSDRTVDPDVGLASPEVRESAAGVIGITFGLVLVALLVVFVWRQETAPIDGRALLAEAFALGELPAGLEVEAASRLAGGERVVALANPEATEPERVEQASEDEAEDEAVDDTHSSGMPGAPGMPDVEPYDWTTLAIGPAGTPPLRAFVVWYPLAGARAELDRQFRWIDWRDLRDFHADGGRMPLERGVVDWSGYEAGYVIERELERGGTFRDWMRVNLTFDNEARVLVARWARGSPASKGSVAELLAALKPHAK